MSDLLEVKHPSPWRCWCSSGLGLQIIYASDKKKKEPQKMRFFRFFDDLNSTDQELGLFENQKYPNPSVKKR